MPDAEDVFASLEATLAPGTGGPQLGEVGIQAAELRLGRTLPADLRQLCEHHNGGVYLDGNLSVWPLTGSERSLVEGTLILSQPLQTSELIIFGDTGADELLAIWSPIDSREPSDSPVILIARAIHSFAPLGTTITRFLHTWIAMYGADPDYGEAGDASKGSGPLEMISQVLARTDPLLPDQNPDPYARGWTIYDLGVMFGQG